MGVVVKFGNLEVSDIERKLGIVFSDEHRNLLETTRQENVKNPLLPRSWHYFDLPNELVFGSYKFFNEFREILTSYELKGRITVSYELADDEKIENHYELKNEDGFPNYLSCEEITEFEGKGFRRHHFWKLVRVNKLTLVYQRIGQFYFNKDVLGVEGVYFFSDSIVPKDDSIYGEEVRIKKQYMDNLYKEEVVHVEKGSIDGVKSFSIWSGERMYDTCSTSKTYEQALSDLKAYKKFRRKAVKD